jgi:2-methylaconitate cis-trans-isomerase PrpF
MDQLSEQKAIRLVLQRGGSSRGLYFHERDLPGPGPRRDRLLQRLMGSPDVVQIDGLGGSRPITSKVAIVSPSQRSDADIDYTFAQVEITGEQVIYTANCGNLSAGVGPFAVDEGLVPVVDGHTTVRIFNTNTNAVIVAEVPVLNGKARVLGDFSVPGVPGTGAEIAMNWVGTVGARTGKLLPTGNAADEIELEKGGKVRATLCDAGNPCVWVRASDFGLSGGELIDEIDGNRELIETAREVRGKAAVMFGFLNDWREVDKKSPAVPIIGFVAPPANYKTLNGADAASGDMDLRMRLLFMNRLHESTAGTASISLAAASRVKGSVVNEVACNSVDNVLLIGHPSGITPAKVRARETKEAPFIAFELLGFSRTSRRLMEGMAYYPSNTLDDIDG